jgi:hypothetical protein
MTVFKYIEDKDMFQAFYHKMLCKRLVTDASASEEAVCLFLIRASDSYFEMNIFLGTFNDSQIETYVRIRIH